MRPLLVVSLIGCSQTLDLTGPRRICPNDAGCVDPAVDAGAGADCVEACAAFRACAESCAADPEALEAACTETCASSPEAAATLATADDCAVLLETGAPADYGACADERCERYGARLTGCIVAECAAAGQVFEGLQLALTAECRRDTAAGALALSTLDALEPDACTASGWATRVQAALAGTGPGELGPLCTAGPALDSEVCELSCDVARACLDALEAPCLFACATRAEARSVAECLAQAEVGDCEAARACTTVRQ